MKYSANSVWENRDGYDIAVIGAGHAGCEAALAAARLGFQTVMFTVSVDSIALCPVIRISEEPPKGILSGKWMPWAERWER